MESWAIIVCCVSALLSAFGGLYAGYRWGRQDGFDDGVVDTMEKNRAEMDRQRKTFLSMKAEMRRIAVTRTENLGEEAKKWLQRWGSHS